MNHKYQKAVELIQEQLKIVTLNDRTKLMLNNSAFLKEVVKNVSALKVIEEFSIQDQTKMNCYKYLDQINASVKEKQVFFDYKLPANEVDLIDEVKFLNKLAINFFGQDLESIKKLSLDATTVLPFETSNESTNQNQSSQTATSSNNSNQNNSNTQTNNNSSQNSSYNYGNPSDYKESYINQMAMQRLTNEIKTGKVFIYTHKPKAVPIIKYALSLFYGFLALMNIGLIIFLIYLWGSNASYTVYFDADNKIVLGPTDKSLNIFASTNSIISYVFPILYTLIFIYIALSNLRGMKQNDNVKYTMKFFLISFLAIMGLVSLFQNANGSIFNQIALIRNTYPDSPAHSFYALDLYNALTIANIVLSSATILSIIFIVPYLVLRPKINIQLQMSLLKQYRDEIKALNNF